MNKAIFGFLIYLTSFLISFLFQLPAFGYDFSDKFSIGGILAGVYQYQSGENIESEDRGTISFHPEFSLRATQIDKFFTKVGFAAGNGLNGVTEFNLNPWAVALEDDVKNINGRYRDYILTAWYKHTFKFAETRTIGLTGGLIDAADYIYQNAYADDEYNQFMNQALVNGPDGFAPSYDVGGALEFNSNSFSVNAVVMNVGENEDGNNYNFIGVQLGYTVNTFLGKGSYRLIGDITNKEFINTKGGNKERLASVFLSFDQELGEIVGVWIRCGAQDDRAAVDYANLYSGGINISGKVWGREDDNLGIGYAHLDNGNLNIEYSRVAEAYVRFALNQYFAFTVDLQYMKDKIDYKSDPQGFIFGLRMTAKF